MLPLQCFCFPTSLFLARFVSSLYLSYLVALTFLSALCFSPRTAHIHKNADSIGSRTAEIVVKLACLIANASSAMGYLM